MIPVINLSACTLSQSQLKVLGKGLSYSPTRDFNLYNTHYPESTNKKYFSTDIEDSKFLTFQDQSMICELRSLQQESSSLIDSPKKYVIPGNNQFYSIQSRPYSLDIYQDLLERELTALYQKVKNNDNLQGKAGNLTPQ